jgi:uncharacterized protein (TIGR00730 family)
MSKESLEALLFEVQELFERGDEHLYDVLLKQILLNVLKLKRDNLDTLDLKVINRSFREIRYAFKIFKPYRHVRKVSIFGSARTPEDHPHYRMAVAFARLLAQEGFMVITGAAYGIMKAGNEGAGADKSFGVNIHLPKEQEPNEFIVDDPKLVSFKYFFTRKLIFIMESSAVALFPGGFGTHDEGFETLTLLQTGKASARPLILLEPPGEDYWLKWDEFVRGQLLSRHLISPDDISLYSIVNSPEDAVEKIKLFYSTYHSNRRVGNQLVVRLEKELSDEHVKELNARFGDIVADGSIIKSAALPEEANEPELSGKPRLVFAYNLKSAGRLHQFIERINEMGKPIKS